MLAAVASCWIVCCGVFAMRHEASVAHARDPHTGELRHAPGIIGDHSTDQSDVHGSSGDVADDHACVISATLHQASQVTTTRPLVFEPSRSDRPFIPAVAAVPRSATVYRFAPKTSPPALV